MIGFGIPIADRLPVEPTPGDSRVVMNLSVDPDFGPIWRFHRQGETSILRITPLTDVDIAEVMERLQLPSVCGLAETLGRLTQLVEELPWVCILEAEVWVPPEAGTPLRPMPLRPGLRVAVSQAEYQIP
jgi:hypothetical protein